MRQMDSYGHRKHKDLIPPTGQFHGHLLIIELKVKKRLYDTIEAQLVLRLQTLCGISLSLED